MKCSIVFVCVLVCLAKFCEGWVLRCPPGVQDSSCTEENIEVETQESSVITEVQCLAGTEWESNCHYCRCSDTGVAECVKQDICNMELFVEPSLCKPNTTFLRDCNTCVCLDNGLGLCTLRNCRRSHVIKNTPEISDVSTSEKVSTKQAETPAATLPIGKSNNATKPQVCVANRMFVKDCNTCLCNEDGTSYICTRRTCVPLLPDEEPDLGGIPAEDLRVTFKACHPNEVFELDCNMCRCNPDGKSYSCTRRACVETEDKEKIILSRKVRAVTTGVAKTCLPGQEFRMDCNQCLCDNLGLEFSCTRIDCSASSNDHDIRIRRKRETTGDIDTKCVAGSVFDRDCNVCRCTTDGNHATCTIKRCRQDSNSESRPTESDGGFRCNPGEQFKRGCNDCTCSADGKSEFCTILMCDEDIATNM